ncbi:MAG: hypothetical protein M1553_00950, partial [Firmicutes bacterium]|nr:hypothetical protein [Bacillota bacterium]
DHYEVGYFLVDGQDLSLRGSSLQNRPGTEVVFTVLAATIPLKDFLDPAKGSELEAAELARRAALLEQAGVTDDPGGKAMTRYYQAAPAMGQRTGSPGHDASDEAPPSHPREGSKGLDETPRPPAKGGASYRATGPNVIPAGDQELTNDGEVGFARALVLAAADFIVQRQSTGTRTIIAGYPWFTDWGRDTMIALPGLTLVTGRYEVARELLLTFARYCRDGLIPNLFPERGEEPLYNTIDASLWYFHAVRKYLEYTGDYDFILREIYPVLQGIVAAHLAGTRFNIAVDPEDGLLAGGCDGLQLTWMDAKIDGRVVTPREGKPVEVNALWYNALRVMEDLAGRASAAREQTQSADLLPEGRYVNRVASSDDHLSSSRIPAKTQSSLDLVVRVKEGTLPGMAEDFTQSVGSVKAGREEDYRTLAERVKMSFQKFWYPGGGYLYDVLTNAGPDPSLRPNQIMAVSLPYSPLTTDQAEQVVRKVWRHLYTTYGLRTLAPGHPDYKGQYDGDRFTRDAAYHQGTAWAWLVGPFVTAYCRVHHWSPESRQQARAFLQPFREHLFDAGLGTISEIFSGNPPHAAVGCLAQAWSVGEVLRAWVEEVQGRKPPDLTNKPSPANGEAQ